LGELFLHPWEFEDYGLDELCVKIAAVRETERQKARHDYEAHRFSAWLILRLGFDEKGKLRNPKKLYTFDWEEADSDEVKVNQDIIDRLSSWGGAEEIVADIQESFK